MKKIILFCLAFLCYKFSFAQTLTTSSTTVASGSTITLTGSGEASAHHFVAESSQVVWNVDNSAYLNNQSIVFTNASYYNTATQTPTSLQFKVTNTASVPVKVTYRIQTTPYDDVHITTLPDVFTLINLTVNPVSNVVYYNTIKSITLKNNTCTAGYASDSYTYTVPANTYSGSTQTEADQKAQDDVNNNAQNVVNQHTTCVITFYNSPISEVFTPPTKLSPDSTYLIVYQPYTYTVPAGRYSASTQAAADALAQNDINTLGQSYANTHALSHFTGVIWSQQSSADFTKNDCPSGTAGGVVTYIVPARKYYTTTDDNRAGPNLMALVADDINANGQNYANTYGTCSSNQIIYVKLVSVSGSPPDGQLRITAYFYSDAASTQPIFVNNLSVSYNVSGTGNKLVTGSGQSFILEYVTNNYNPGRGGPPPPTPSSLGYTLNSSPSYIIIN